MPKEAMCEDEIEFDGMALYVLYDYEYCVAEHEVGHEGGYIVDVRSMFNSEGIPVELSTDEVSRIENILADRLKGN